MKNLTTKLSKLIVIVYTRTALSENKMSLKKFKNLDTLVDCHQPQNIYYRKIDQVLITIM
jgi:hypothetical protein